MDPNQYLTTGQAAKLIPGKPCATTVWRWCTSGWKAANGAKVKLQCAKFGKKIFTTKEWIEDFGKACADSDSLEVSRFGNVIVSSSSDSEIEAACIAEGI